MKEKIQSSFTLENVIQLATAAHEGQKDKAGKDYILHPLRVMSRMKGELSQMTAILHDVIEDTNITYDDLRKLGIGEEIIAAIELLTHPVDYKGSTEEYFANIETIAKSNNQIAIDVKFSDLIDNSDITRVENPTEKDFNRVKKYQKAMAMLEPFVGDYLLEYK